MNRLLLVSISPAALLVILVGPFVQIGVAQLGLPASLVGGLVALQMLVSATRPWLGRLGDRHPRGAAGRLALLRWGLLATWSTLPLVLLGLLQVGRLWPASSASQRALVVAAVAALMLIVALGNHLSQTMQAALLMEPLPAGARSRIVRRLWLCINLFTVLASLLSAAVLQGLKPLSLAGQLIGLWLFWALVVSLLVAIALHGARLPRASAAQVVPRHSRGPGMRTLLSGGFLPLLFLVHAPLYAQEVLLDPWATRLFGWPLAATATLIGSWAVGTLLGQGWALLRPVRPSIACLSVALVYGLLALRAPVAALQLLPIPVLVAGLGLASGWLQLWVAGQVGERCGGHRVGEMVGWLSAAVVFSRSLGVALGGPLLDGAGWLFGTRSAAAFAMAFGCLALLMLAGAFCCLRVERRAA
jgi:BCD family chlorophyll transporter-like MFS transporter